MKIDTAEVFAPLWQASGKRYIGAYGGRGSGKSHDRALHCVARLLDGARIVGLREVQRSIKDSVKQLVEDKIDALGVRGEFGITRDEIRGPNNSLMIFRGLQDHTAESIKSLEGFEVAWIEEAQTITRRSWDLLYPTIRKPGSQIWATWNPTNEDDPLDQFFRVEPPGNAISVQANWRDNPWFPAELRDDIERDRRGDPLRFQHIWEGAYQVITEGAYYAEEIAKARNEGRVCPLQVERGPRVVTAWDLGIDDETAIWVAQVVGREVRLIDYIAGSDGDAAHWARKVMALGLDYETHIMPHDAGYREKGSGRSYVEHLADAGLSGQVRVMPRTNDVVADIADTRAFIAKCVFNSRSEGVGKGLKALGSYRREYDDRLRTFKARPLHDWASHGADAFRALATGLVMPQAQQPRRRERNPWAA